MNTTAANFDYVLWKWPKREDAIYPVKLRVTYKDKRKYYGKKFNLDLHLSEDDFLSIVKGNPRNAEKKKVKTLLEARISRAEKIASEMDPFVFDFDEFEKRILKQDESKAIALIDALREYSKKADSPNTQKVYHLTVNAIKKYDPKVTFSQITVPYLEDLEKHLRLTGLANSTITIHIRNIRAAFNYAIRQKLVSKDRYPFGKDKYTPPKPSHSKKLTDIEVIKKLWAFNSPDHEKQFARDLYIFSFFLGGANPKDIFQLSFDNIETGQIKFRRGKTGNVTEIAIPIIDSLQDVIDRQMGQYMFDVATDRMSESSLINKAKKIRRRVNDLLRQIVGVDITLHEARHSFASYASINNMPPFMISAFMGHSNKSVTEGYASYPSSEKKKFLLKLEKYIKSNE